VAGATVQLDGSGTDTAGLTVSYLWVQTAGPDAILSDSTAQNPTFVAPTVSANTELIFELRVSVGTFTSVDTVTIHVSPSTPTTPGGTDETPTDDNDGTGDTGGTDQTGGTTSQTPAEPVPLSDILSQPLAGAAILLLILLALFLLWFLWV
ncbi:MAG: hypothetical protein HY718_22065, partial [Planctomycetes bacterium]|nr:hypothetical protein [Planctomycetota bacterium]